MSKVVTFGCRLNLFESEIIKNNIADLENDNLIVFNTCSVTKESERQARQSIRREKRNNPDAKIVVTGCSAQINPDQYLDMPEVDQILGNEEKLEAKSFLSTQKALVNDIMSVKETASHLIHSVDGKARGFVQVQNGCNHRCTFCIIPYGRGNSRSVPVGEIVKQVKILVDNGYNEIVLTGVDITDYGKDLPACPTLGQMMRRLLSLVPNLPRLRLSSIDVAEIDADLWDLIKNEPRLMPHFHISLQAGDDMILKRMKRRHKRQDVIDFTNKIRDIKSGKVAFGADIIAGFPTETDAMFENSFNLISEAGLQHLHIFPYSSREGTPAAKMPQIEKAIRKKRASLLRSEGEKQLAQYYQSKIGETMRAIVENGDIARGEDYSEIKTDTKYDFSKYNIGDIIKIKIISNQENHLKGDVI